MKAIIGFVGMFCWVIAAACPFAAQVLHANYEWAQVGYDSSPVGLIFTTILTTLFFLVTGGILMDMAGKKSE